MQPTRRLRVSTNANHPTRLLLVVPVLLALAILGAACGGVGEGGAADATAPASGESEDAGATPGSERLTSENEGDSRGSAAGLEPVSGRELIYGIASDGTGFSTTDALHADSSRIITAPNDPLVAVTASGDWTPNVAKSLTPNDDFTEWTLAVRPGVVFHDGAPLNAAAVVANLQAFKAGPNVGFALSPATNIVAVDDLQPHVLPGEVTAGNQPDDRLAVRKHTVGNREARRHPGPSMTASQCSVTRRRQTEPTNAQMESSATVTASIAALASSKNMSVLSP